MKTTNLEQRIETGDKLLFRHDFNHSNKSNELLHADLGAIFNSGVVMTARKEFV